MKTRMIQGVKTAARARVTVSLSAGLVQRLDARSAREGVTRSGLVERLLSDAESESERTALEASVAAYYASEPTEDDGALSKELARAARRVFTGSGSPPEKRRSRR